MALRNCPECNKEISTTAESCPNCGYKLKKEPDKKKSSGCAVGCLAIVIVIVVIGVIGSLTGGGSSNSTSTTSSSTVDLSASIRFTGTQFIISNNDSFDWTNVKLEVNSKGFKSGYILNTSLISSGNTYTVGAMQFAKKDGEKFNPFSHKALNMSIWCDTPKGKGFYMGGWN